MQRKMWQKTNKILVFLSVFLLTACNNNTRYEKFHSFDESWKSSDTVSFVFENKDTTQLHQMYIYTRTNNKYPFSNLFLIVKMNSPENKTTIDTLEYVMTNPDGTLLGKGVTATKTSKLWYKENFKFLKAGKYNISIEQANRETGKIEGVMDLQGITEIGLRIEKK